MAEKEFDQLYQEWLKKTEELLAKFPERKERFTTLSGIEVERLYTRALDEKELIERVGFPGEYPYTRGIRPTMYRGRHWTMRQYAGYGSAETNRRSAIC